MSKTPFKVLKLRSGDDVVARLIKNTKEFIRLERPMVIKVMHYVEPMGGSKKETIVLYDWMKMTTSNHIDIPEITFLEFLMQTQTLLMRMICKKT